MTASARASRGHDPGWCPKTDRHASVTDCFQTSSFCNKWEQAREVKVVFPFFSMSDCLQRYLSYSLGNDYILVGRA